MRTVECPVCSCKVEGSNESDLSTCVHVHFCEEHGMEPEVYPQESEGRTTGGREAEGRTVVAGRTGEGGESASSYSVDCPGCRERVSGRSEEEMSSNLREHMTAEHRKEPYMTRLTERLGRR